MARCDEDVCPKCGSRKWSVQTINSLDGKWYIARCHKCHFKTVECDSRDDAIDDFLEGREYDDIDPKPNSKAGEEDDGDQSVPGMWRIRRG